MSWLIMVGNGNQLLLVADIWLHLLRKSFAGFMFYKFVSTVTEIVMCFGLLFYIV